MKQVLCGAVSAVALWTGCGYGAGMALGAAGEPALPEPPREWVDTAMPAPAGRTISVPAGGDLQEALDDAQPGDVIALRAGAVYRGPFTLPNKKSGTGWITIRSDAVEQLPAPGTTVHPSQASLMPKLTSRKSSGVVLAEKGAHHYRFIGIEMAPEDGVYIYSLLWLGNNQERSIGELPHHVIVDRCYLHGDPKKGSRRGVALNGRHLAVIDSYLSDFKEAGADSQAIMGWSGPGPFKIVNNHLEAAAEPINFGGGDPSIRNLVPSDIEIRHNYLTKPLSWKRGEPGYDGSAWSVKNLFELKNARRVLIDGNVLEHNWEESQNGFAVLFTVRNQDGTAPWSAIEDVRFTNNIVRHSGSGLNLTGHDDNHPDQTVQTKRILIQNNLWEDIGGKRWGGRGILFQVLWGTSDVVIKHNTGMQTGSVIHSEGPPHTAFVFRHNVMPHNEWGIFGRDAGTGTRALEALFPGAVVTGNILAGGDEARYPSGNRFVSSVGDLPLMNAMAGNQRRAASEEYEAEAGKQERPGVDVPALCRALGLLKSKERLCHTPVAGALDQAATER